MVHLGIDNFLLFLLTINHMGFLWPRQSSTLRLFLPILSSFCACFIICVLVAVEKTGFERQESWTHTGQYSHVFFINQFYKVSRNPVTTRAPKYESPIWVMQSKFFFNKVIIVIKKKERWNILSDFIFFYNISPRYSTEYLSKEIDCYFAQS